ncbi:LytR/AlgR family response regulator transcription factor [Peribacillus asahii]|uniref:LytR/AlgR family response regulator transcription factor n=1 Tax=Peribacillus asahii TaxID=228899 RepID=UPI0038075F48
MLRAYIVDDEPLARDELKYLLIRSKQVEVVGEADGLEQAIIDIPAQEPDLVFLDIELAEDNGLQLAKQLHALKKTPAIVFATAYDEYALEAFELNALDYLLKPFDEQRVHQMLDKITKLQKIGEQDIPPSSKVPINKTGKIAILVEERIILLDATSILFVESSEGKCMIKTKDDAFKVSEALVALEKKLQDSSFMRVHRSYIVNIHYISEIQPWFNSTYNLIMNDGSNVPVSRTYIKELKQLLQF